MSHDEHDFCSQNGKSGLKSQYVDTLHKNVERSVTDWRFFEYGKSGTHMGTLNRRIRDNMIIVSNWFKLKFLRC